MDLVDIPDHLDKPNLIIIGLITAIGGPNVFSELYQGHKSKVYENRLSSYSTMFHMPMSHQEIEQFAYN